MRRILTAAVVLWAVLPARAVLVSERWAGSGTPAAHQGTLRAVRDGALTRLEFDLSALPAEAAVRHASLYCFTKGNAQPVEPARILAAAGEALKLEGPWYRSFDATSAARRWAESRKGPLALKVARFDGLLAGRSYLEIRYEAPRAKGLPEQVTGLRAVHHHGQTFLVWTELEAFRPPPASVFYVSKFSRRGNEMAKKPGEGWGGLPRVPAITLKTLRELQGMELRDRPSGFQGIRAAKRVREVPEVRYRVYRHTARITSANLKDAQWVGIADPLNSYDQKMAVISFKGEYIDQREVGGSVIPTSCVEDGKPVAAGEAIYVHNPAEAGKFYYAVTSALAGTENAAEIGPGNSLAKPVDEKPMPPRPVLQRLQDCPSHRKDANVVEKWHLFWAAPPYANLPSRPYHVLVGEPVKLTKAKTPSPMIIDGFHGGFNIVGALRTPSWNAVTLLVEHQIAWGGDGGLLYNEGLGTLRSFRECKVRYFSERYFLRMIDWARRNWKIDGSRIYGGQHDSGPLHLGVRHPEIFKRVFLGNYTASYVYQWAPPSSGLARIMGPRDLARTPQGHRAWDVLDLTWYLRQNPARDIPLIWGGSNTGKDSGHTCEFGWQDDPRGWAALQRARQPFVIAWGVGSADPGGAAGYHSIAPDIRKRIAERSWDKTIPAFSNCSLDDNPGNGDPADGDFCGQMNGQLVWDDADSIDEAGRWEMTVRVVGTCPEQSGTVDVTPRHCRAFKPRRGEKFKWTNTSLADKTPVQSGTAQADQWGLVTVKGARVAKGGNRISIQRQ